MMKQLATSALTIVLATGGMMLWQWNVHSKQEDANRAEDVEQHIQIEQRENSLQVTQRITGLGEGMYPIKNPAAVQYYMEGTERPSGRLLVISEGSEPVLRYELPFDGGKSFELLEDWALMIGGDVITVRTRVDITVPSGQQGHWAAAGSLAGEVRKQFIDFYQFEREGPAFPLLYNQRDWDYKELKSGAFLYDDGTVKLDVEAFDRMLMEYWPNDGTVYIFTKHHRQNQQELLCIYNDSADLEKKLEAAYMDERVPFKGEQAKWQQAVIVNIAEDRQIGNAKSHAMAEELKKQLPEEEFLEFSEEVLAGEGPLDSAILDWHLSEAAGKRTSFFSDNKSAGTRLSPLYFLKAEPIYVEGAEIDGAVVELSDEELFPAREILEQAGYTMDYIDRKEVFVAKEGYNLRLFPDELVFIMNGTDYSVITPPVIDLDGRLLISESWLLELFGGMVEKDGKGFYIKFA
ncbi:MAG: stalk domain-containing protein [Bacillus sp. (in: firmicutes)]